MIRNILKSILPALVFIIFLIPVVTSSLLDLEQKKANELRLEQELQEKIYLMGKFDPALREDFVLIPSEYTIEQMNQYKIYLRKEAFEAYLQMKNAADLDSVDLKIASATRNFYYQKDLWGKEWNGTTLVDGKNLLKSIPDKQERFKKILEYIAVPGTSRHHWGTDIDINGANLSYFKKDKGKKEYEWLKKNAYLFGFCQTYNLKGSERPTGYNEEKWHWSYIPLSRKFTQEYKNLMKNEDIRGFEGDEYVAEQDLINNYVLSINPECI